MHASIVTRFPPPPEEAVVFFGDFLLATAFAFVPDAFLALLAAVAARDFAMVLLAAMRIRRRCETDSEEMLKFMLEH